MKFDRSINTILLTLTLSNVIYGLAAPFLPNLIEEGGIESTWTGIIFAVFAVALTIVSLIVGQFLDRIGHTKVMTAGCILMSLACASFGLLIYIDDKQTFIIAAIVLRTLQGKCSVPERTTHPHSAIY